MNLRHSDLIAILLLGPFFLLPTHLKIPTRASFHQCLAFSQSLSEHQDYQPKVSNFRGSLLHVAIFLSQSPIEFHGLHIFDHMICNRNHFRTKNSCSQSTFKVFPLRVNRDRVCKHKQLAKYLCQNPFFLVATTNLVLQGVLE